MPVSTPQPIPEQRRHGRRTHGALRHHEHSFTRNNATNRPPLVDHGRMLDLLEFEGRLLVAATHDAHPDSPAAGVCGRTLAETVRHAGDQCEDTLTRMGTTASTASAVPKAPRKTAPNRTPPTDGSKRELAGRFTARLADLLAEFGTRPPTDPCPTWWPDDPSITFWIRRMLHATTMNRVDAQTAAGIPVTPVAADVACDGIDEALRLWFGYRLGVLGVTPSDAWSLSVVTHDYHWRVEADREHTTAMRAEPNSGSAEDGADGVITGAAPSVYLWLWGRLPNRMIGITGDHDAIAQLWSLLRLATR
ncbi:hypothetical protein [Haloactinomyces albus]|uniref:MDMPI C-terminal domain-containing protein n=1 Tax=Haloactinomyces albus TaxID=1352928 RepID=A0AAE4CN70_9ACTN|nr:hypothetical protein [Haloactinomyces albus]MDR7303116.1 hypothetical protein [Haloactinomyces albus]